LLSRASRSSRSPGPIRRFAAPRGKDDTLDAIAAARAALSGQRISIAKDRSGQIEALRVLRVTRTTAVKCRRATIQTLRNTITAAPDEVRDQLRNLTPKQLLRTGAAWRPDRHAFRDPAMATKIACKSLASRLLELDDEIADLNALIEPLVAETAPRLLERGHAVGRASRPRSCDGRGGDRSARGGLAGDRAQSMSGSGGAQLERGHVQRSGGSFGVEAGTLKQLGRGTLKQLGRD
jgi:hypothetical protein